jgi:hypothetical protein
MSHVPVQKNYGGNSHIKARTTYRRAVLSSIAVGEWMANGLDQGSNSRSELFFRAESEPPREAESFDLALTILHGKETNLTAKRVQIAF